VSLINETKTSGLILSQEISLKEGLLSEKRNELEIVKQNVTTIWSDDDIKRELAIVREKIKDLKLHISPSGITSLQSVTLNDLERDENELLNMLFLSDQDARKKPFRDKIIILEDEIISLPIEIKKLKQHRDELFNASTNKIKNLNTTISGLFEEQLLKEQGSFLKKPEDWVYYIGVPFAFSAFIAIILSNFDHSQPPKGYRPGVGISLGSMAVGFAYLIGIFFTIGSG